MNIEIYQEGGMVPIDIFYEYFKRNLTFFIYRVPIKNFQSGLLIARKQVKTTRDWQTLELSHFQSQN